LSSFALAGAVAGIGGALFAGWSQFVNPGQFSVNAATLVVVFVLVGGRRSPAGSVIGAFLISALQFYFGSSGFSQYVTLILGIIVVVVVLVAPDGVSALAANSWKRIRGAFTPGTSQSPIHVPVLDEEDFPYERFISSAGEGSQATEKLLAVTNLSKGFGGVKAVQSVDFTLEPKEIKCIIGPNGAGKSTLFGLLSGRLRQDQGSIILSGTDISRAPSFKRARRGIGIKLQTASFFSELTVRENIDLAARIVSSEDRPGLVRACIAEVGLNDFAEREAFSLSHGQQQWLEIGMVLAQLPKLILLDEPVAGMTLGERSETVRMIHRLSKYCGVLVVEHDMSVVEELGAEVIVMHEGKVLRTGVIEAIRKDEAVLEAYLGRDSDPSAAVPVDGELEGGQR
jgi:branched-chain amino acid transport system permease protein